MPAAGNDYDDNMNTLNRHTFTRVEWTDPRAAALAFVSQLWLFEVDADLVSVMQQPAIAETLAAIGGVAPIADSPDALEELAVDYCQLFIGPGNGISPIQSIHSEQRYHGDAFAACVRFYDLVPDFDHGDAMADHLGVQLHFAAVLIEMQTAVKDDAIQLDELRQVLQQFNRSHLGWAVPLTRRLIEGAQTPFYRSLGTLTGRLIEEIGQWTGVTDRRRR